MKRVIRRYELTDEEWGRLKKYFQERQPGTLGRPQKDSRDILNGIFWIARSGAAWRNLPERYGPWQTVYKRFVEWQKSGLIEKIFHELQAHGRNRFSSFLKLFRFDQALVVISRTTWL